MTIVADQETIADFAFGPVTISGDLVLGPMSAPTGGLGFGIVGAKIASITHGHPGGADAGDLHPGPDDR